MTPAQKVRFEVAGPIAIITLDRPDRRNAIDTETGLALAQAFDRLDADEALRVGVLRAEGAVFCAGMDLKAFSDGEAEAILFGAGRLGGLVSRTRRRPVIAAVQGPALAGGFELVLACDLVVASRDASFGLPESRIGLIAGAGGAFRLGQRIPPVVANEMLLTGAPISAERAEALGLVNRLVESAEVMQTALALAEAIAANAPLAVTASLDLATASRRMNEARLWKRSDDLLREMIGTEDAGEGARAFAEKRPPVWHGR